MPYIDIKKQSCSCCYSGNADYTLKIGNHEIPICKNCMRELRDDLQDALEGTEWRTL